MKISKINFTIFAAIILLLLLGFTKNTEPIRVHVKFVAQSDNEFKKGTLRIVETGEIFEITEVKDFSFRLQKGNYTLRFTSETPHRIVYPGKITRKQNEVIIYLGNSKSYIEEYASEKNWQQLLKEDRLKFIHLGFAPVHVKEFYEKYKIDVKNEGCVITPVISSAAEHNNRIVANYLTSKFGTEWKKDLGFLPFGVYK